MKLEFNNKLISGDLLEELGTNQYLDLFDIDMPILPHRILDYKNKKNATSLFQELKNIKSANTNLKKIISLCQDLPNLTWTLQTFKNKELNQISFCLIGNFILTTLDILKHEKNQSIHRNTLKDILLVIEEKINIPDGSFLDCPKASSLTLEIQCLTKKIVNFSQIYEKEILQETNIKMVYPWPKEIPNNEKTLKLLEKSKLLTFKKEGNFLSLKYLPSKLLQEEINKKTKAEDKLTQHYQQVLKRLNQNICKYNKEFTNIYHARIEKTYEYILAYTAIKHKLCIPVLSDTPQLEIKSGRLPSLIQKRKDKYIPLNLKLASGPNILFGANMAGKTSALKTIHFISLLVSVGLPVPAKELTIHFPSEVKLHLKSSGAIKNNLSSFGEELEFFASDFKSGSIISVDELFQTTNPIAGKELSGIFLNHFKNKKFIFFCTTQFPDILNINGINIYKMKDINTESFNNIKSIKSLLDKMPYTIEKVTTRNQNDIQREGEKALILATKFIKNNTLKKNIQKKIKG